MGECEINKKEAGVANTQNWVRDLIDKTTGLDSIYEAHLDNDIKVVKRVRS